MRTISCGLLLAAAAVSALRAQSPNNVKIDNGQVRVIAATDPPHRKGRVHEHTMNRVMIYLDAGRQDITDAATGKVEHQSWKAGEVRWSPARGPHTSENVGGNTFRIIEIELNGKPGSPRPAPPLDPLKVAPKNYKLEFENEQVRVLRVKYAPHEKGVLHEHVMNRVSVPLTEESLRVSTPDGRVTNPQAHAGEPSWGVPVKHQEENLSDGPLEVVAVEIK
jgi:hypothetical protein